MVEPYHRLDGHRLGRTVGVGDGQGCLAFCSPWGHKELDMTEQLNKTHLNFIFKMDLIKVVPGFPRCQHPAFL